MESPADLLLTIYRAAREQPLEAFQDVVVSCIRPALRFDASFWGAGRLLERASGLVLHTAHMAEIDVEQIEEWQILNPNDKTIQICAARPGIPVPLHSRTLFAGREGRAMRDFASRAGWEAGLTTASLTADRSGAQWLSLYRSDSDDQFGPEDTSLARFLMPHVFEALSINRTLHLKSVYGPDVRDPRTLAIADQTGFMHYAEASFIDLVTLEWPAWEGGRLPLPLLVAIASIPRGEFVGAKAVVQFQRHEGMLYLRARVLGHVDRLTRRESEVAQMFAAGKSHKVIAQQLGLAPATVRNHLQMIYAKLGIHTKTELAKHIDRA